MRRQISLDGRSFAKYRARPAGYYFVRHRLAWHRRHRRRVDFEKKYPDLTILMLSVYTDNGRIFDALCAGACGYLLKKTPPAKIIESLREAVSGGAPMSPEVARKVIALFRDVRPPERVDDDLSPHEERILKMLVEGHTKKNVAAALGVSFHTVSFHLRSIYEKLQVHSKSEAVVVASRHRLIK